MAFNPDHNPYISLVKSRPESILHIESREESDGLWSLIHRKYSNFSKLFLELGSGSGAHILELAKGSPESLFVGAERRYKRCFRTIEKAEQQEIANLLMLRADFANFFPHIFPEASLDGIYINFPDPWEKKRWKKHRSLNADFFTALHGLLKPEAFFSFKTDHGDYFEEVVGLVEERFSNHFELTGLSRDLHKSEFAEANIETEFEQLFKSQGLPINFIQLKKK